MSGSIILGGASTSDDQELCCQQNICIILLVGIPGSGKSYFRTFLENHFKKNFETVLGFLKVFSVSYDDFCKVKNPNQFHESVRWKEDRLEIFRKVENIIRYLKTLLPQGCNSVLENVRIINCEIENPDSVLFIVDDNMYYRSMRYEYYKLSRSYNLSFCQIYFDATKQDALKYNAKRELEAQVPDFVIEKMCEKLEPPDETISWEKQTLRLKPYLDFEEDGVCESVISLINTALKCPVQQNFQSSKKEEAQQINNSNAIHQIDILLKQLVGNLIKKRIRESGDNLRTSSQYFSEQRLVLLKEIKDRKIILPVDLSEPISKQDVEVIKPILSECLGSYLFQ